VLGTRCRQVSGAVLGGCPEAEPADVAGPRRNVMGIRDVGISLQLWVPLLAALLS